MQRETFTSTKLQLHIYTDAQCSQHFDDGETSRKHSTRGYQIGNKVLSAKVSFKPEFYSCLTCEPDAISYTFNKKNSNWYDDDYISTYGNKQSKNQSTDDGQNNSSNSTDDGTVDDQYYSNNDDYGQYSNNTDDAYGNRMLKTISATTTSTTISASKEDLQAYHNQFWEEYEQVIQSKQQQNNGDRSLYDNNYDIGDWNMCQRLYRYGVWCDEGCRALDFFRTNNWSASDVFLLGIMCLFMTAMLLLIIAKRLKAQQKARMYGEDHPIPGLPPFAMVIIFIIVMCIVITLAKVKFINETLVFSVVTCILLFIYMLKLTLFESRRPILLAAPRHDMYNNKLNDHLFD